MRTSKPKPSAELTVLICLDSMPWRMLRRALRVAPSAITFQEIRNWRNIRKEREQLQWLCKAGLLELTESGSYRITPAGIAAADMGECRSPMSLVLKGGQHS